MKLRLDRLNKSYLNTSLVAPSLFRGTWKIGEVKEVADKTGYDILSKFHGLFSIVTNEKPPENKMVEKASVTMEQTAPAREMVNKAGRPPKKLER